MTDKKPKRNYDGNSEACIGCKAFYKTGDIGAPCDTCSYRINEEKEMLKSTDQKPNCGVYPNIFWDKKITFSCNDCGYIMSNIDHKNTVNKYSPEIETEMDFFICPQCGKEAIVLW